MTRDAQVRVLLAELAKHGEVGVAAARRHEVVLLDGQVDVTVRRVGVHAGGDAAFRAQGAGGTGADARAQFGLQDFALLAHDCLRPWLVRRLSLDQA